jgi:flagellar hook-associated protein 3 FlgL
MSALAIEAVADPRLAGDVLAHLEAQLGSAQRLLQSVLAQGVAIRTQDVDLQALLGDGQAASDDRLLHVLRDVADHLRGGTAADADALRTTDLRRLETNLDVLNGIRADVGARTNRLAVAESRLGGLGINASRLLSQTEDADMAQTITDYTTQQAAYTAALRAGSSIVQASLLDFLH